MNDGVQDFGSRVDERIFERASVGTVDPDIVKLEARLRAAQLSGDLEALSSLMSEDLLFAGPDGNLVSKNMDIEAYRSGLVKFLRHEPLELHVRRPTRDVAVASLAAKLMVSVGAEVAEGNYRYTRVWQRQDDGQWKVLAGQVGPVNR
ncbi:MAG: nuclear transport factor 2 family protein [Hydrogenophaga sp.]|uniref:nuclear transport factor 2 family protein n=1 Tax=Hydrogenophaga sp. TaxID=1904254 RepID=UPI002AB87285|nr:nuclear transport factor 2 family protein [Hydrogenophaga sp.]MDZ4173273.1 nuclear transport factor 2 family protein [Hydrogenophaga sp.]